MTWLAFYAPPCDPEVFRKGQPLLVIDGWACDVEPWVRRVAKLSGQRVDWHYTGGRAQVLVLGKFAPAHDAAKSLEGELQGDDPDRPGRIVIWFKPGDAGLYRSTEP